MTTIKPVLVGTPTYGQSNGSVSTTLVIPKPDGVQDGDILVAILRCGSSVQTTDYSLAGWVRDKDAFVPSSAGARVSGIYLHYVDDADAEPSSYTFTLASNAFARQSGIIRIARHGEGADPWESLPTIGGSTTYTPSGNNATIGSFNTTDDSLVIYAGGNELVASNALSSWTEPSGATKDTQHGSLTNQADTSATRSVAYLAYEAVTTGGTVTGKVLSVAAASGNWAAAVVIPGTEESVSDVPLGTEIKIGDGSTAYLSAIDGGGERIAPGNVYIWRPGFNDVEALLAKTGATIAHRGGSVPWPQMSEYAYDHSVMRGYGALEFSCGWAKQESGSAKALIPFGLGYQYLDDVSAATGSLNPQTLTWDTIHSTYKIDVNPVSPGVYQDFYRLEEFLTKYARTHVCLVDPKFGFADADQVEAMLDICDSLGGEDHIIIKFDSSETNGLLTTAIKAGSRDYKGMNYWGSNTTDMAAQQSRWDIIGALYSDGTAMAAANSYSKPSWAAVVPNSAGYTTAINNNADLVMISDPSTVGAVRTDSPI